MREQHAWPAARHASLACSWEHAGRPLAALPVGWVSVELQTGWLTVGKHSGIDAFVQAAHQAHHLVLIDQVAISGQVHMVCLKLLAQHNLQGRKEHIGLLLLPPPV